MEKKVKSKREKRIQQLSALIIFAVVSLILNIVFLVNGTINYSKAKDLENSLADLQETYDSDTQNLGAMISQLNYEKQVLIEEQEKALAEAEAKKAAEENEKTLSTNKDPVNYDSGKIAYLTFDDGPSTLTPGILDVLAKYDVKATFFIKGSSIKYYPDVVKREYDEGHTVGNHTVSHSYASVYSSLDALKGEIMDNNERIKAITGESPTAFRFPGGSSNTLFTKYAPNVQLNEWLNLIHELGMEYYDWNVSSLDASSTPVTSAEMLKAVKNYCSGKNQVTILMHDAANKQTTLETLPSIIEYLQSEGYQIEPITSNSKPVQHRVAN